MKYTYSILIQENPIIYHIWYPLINHPIEGLPDIIATEISDLTT